MKLLSNLGALSGSLGNITAATNMGGQYLRTKGNRTNPSTARQQQVRITFSNLAAMWRTLTDAQRESWAEYALQTPYVNSVGDTRFHTAQQCFVGLNARLRDSGATTPSLVAPAVAVPAGLNSATPAVVGGALTMSLAFTTTPLPAGYKLQIKATGPGSPGKDPNENQARVVGYSAAAAVSPITVPIRSVFATGQKSNIYISVMNDTGQISPAIKTSVVAS